MGIFDKSKRQAQDKGKDISNSLEDAVNEKTGNKYSDQTDSAQEAMEANLGVTRNTPKEPPQE